MISLTAWEHALRPGSVTVQPLTRAGHLQLLQLISSSVIMLLAVLL